jgi:hypothetical protein
MTPALVAAALRYFFPQVDAARGTLPIKRYDGNTQSLSFQAGHERVMLLAENVDGEFLHQRKNQQG